MRKLFILYIIWLLGACFIGLRAQQTGNIINPVLPCDRPDPTVIKINNEYWASFTSNEWSPLFPIFTSTDLVNWELISYAFPDGAPQWASHNFWAPELSYDKKQNKVYLHYTARDKQSKRLSCAVAVADTPMGPFKDLGPLIAQESGSIDSFEVRDENGKLYLLWKEDGNSMGLPTPMWAQEMTEDRTRLVGEMHELFHNDTPWEEGLVEGICVFRKHDYFYALYAAASCCDKNCNYKTGVARSRTLLGKWEKYEKNPILIDNNEWRCPGHGTIVEQDGKQYYLYHAYNRTSSVYVGRQGILEEVLWTADGWPYFKNEAGYDIQQASLNFTDTFDGKTLLPIWQWRVTQDISYTTGKEGLNLQASADNRNLGTLLVQPIKALDFTLTATINSKKSTSAAGIGLIGGANNGFGAPLAGIGISVSGTNVQSWKTIDGKTTLLNEMPIKSASNTQIRMIVKDGHILTFEYLAGSKWNVLSAGIDASPYVPWGMGFRIGLCAKGNPETSANFFQVELKHEPSPIKK